MLDLSLRPTKFDTVPIDNDYAVIWDSEKFGVRRVGRIRLVSKRKPQVWAWYIDPPMWIPPWGKSSTTSLAAAKIAFRRAFERFAAETNNSDWQRCFETQDA